MATTPKLLLTKPSEGNLDWGADINHNFDVLDNAVIVKGKAPKDGAYLRIVDGAPAFTTLSPNEAALARMKTQIFTENEAALARTKTQMFAWMGLVLVIVIAASVFLHVRILKKLRVAESGGSQ